MADNHDQDHGGGDHGGGHHVNYKEYWAIFAALAILTGLEVGLVKVPLARGLMISGLIGLALVKAALVGLFYMHLKSETKWLKATVAVPMCLPALYAFVLIAEGAWRMLSE
jgi:cytochrome c oxidase subunit 4